MENVGLSGGGTSSLLALAAELDAADDECDAAAFRNHLVRRIFSSEASGLLDEGLVAGRACLYDTRHLQQELDARAELASVTAELEAVRAEAASYEARATAAEKKLSALSSLPITREQHLTLTSGSSDAPVSAPSVLGAPSTSVPDVNTGHTSARLMDGAAPHPRDLIDSIRGSRLEAARSAGQLHALVDRALAALSRDLYSGQGHALSELLQRPAPRQRPGRARGPTRRGEQRVRGRGGSCEEGFKRGFVFCREIPAFVGFLEAHMQQPRAMRFIPSTTVLRQPVSQVADSCGCNHANGRISSARFECLVGCLIACHLWVVVSALFHKDVESLKTLLGGNVQEVPLADDPCAIVT